MIIGITGDICSGKSTVSNEFKRLGAAVFDADKIAKSCLENSKVKIELFKLFGKQIFKFSTNRNNIKYQEIDKRKLAKIIFRNKNCKKKVEKIVHPLVRKEMFAFLKKNNNKIVVLDIPLLFESGLCFLCNKIVFVKSKYSQVLTRLKKRKMDVNDYKARKKAQMDLNKKLKLSDYIIYNTSTLKCLKSECKELFKKIEEEQNEKKIRN